MPGTASLARASCQAPLPLVSAVGRIGASSAPYTTLTRLLGLAVVRMILQKESLVGRPLLPVSAVGRIGAWSAPYTTLFLAVVRMT